MSEWSGFTDDDLRRLIKTNQVNNGESQLKEISFKKQNKRKVFHPLPYADKPPSNLPDEPKLVKTDDGLKTSDNFSNKNVRSTEISTDPIVEYSAKSASTGTGVQLASKKQCEHENSTLGSEITPHRMQDGDDTRFLMDDSSIIKKEMDNLTKFREQQKLMEEMNRKKKAMLTNAILEKEKRTTAEAKKLLRIKEELTELDQLVVSDISIIRDRIEEASRNYYVAQKRYDSAEKEFIEAKIDLNKRLELKEQLTEHLYSVIHQNELRKATKLHELMGKLEMGEIGADDKLLEEIGHFIPPLLILEQPNMLKSRQNHSNTSDDCKGREDKSACVSTNGGVSLECNANIDAVDLNLNSTMTNSCGTVDSITADNKNDSLTTAPENVTST